MFITVVTTASHLSLSLFCRILSILPPHTRKRLPSCRFSHQNLRSNHLVPIRSTHCAHRTMFCSSTNHDSHYYAPLRPQSLPQHAVLTVSATDSCTHTHTHCIVVFVSSYIPLKQTGSGPNDSSHRPGPLCTSSGSIW